MLSFASEKEFNRWNKPPNKPKKIECVTQKDYLKLDYNKAEFFFTKLHPSTNEYMRWHWTKTYEETQEWHWLVKLLLGRRKIFIPNPEIHTVCYFPDRRRRDPANFIPKFLVDALVKEGVIEDDSAKILKDNLPTLTYQKSIVGTKITVTSRS